MKYSDIDKILLISNIDREMSLTHIFCGFTEVEYITALRKRREMITLHNISHHNQNIVQIEVRFIDKALDNTEKSFSQFVELKLHYLYILMQKFPNTHPQAHLVNTFQSEMKDCHELLQASKFKEMIQDSEIAYINMILGFLSESIVDLQAAYSYVYDAAQQDPEQPSFCNAKARLLAKLGYLDYSIDVYGHALDLEKRHGRGDSKLAAVSLKNLGHLWSEKGEFTKAISLIQQALSIYSTLGNSKNQVSECKDLLDQVKNQ